MLKSPQASRLTLEQLQTAQAILDDSKIEQAELRANPKQLAMQAAFFESPRPFNTYCAIGGNRAGKTIVGGWMIVAKYLRDYATKGAIIWVVSPNLEKSISGPQKELWTALPKHMFGSVKWDEKHGFGGQRPMVLLDPKGRRIVIRFKTAAQYDQDSSSFESEKVSLVWADESMKEPLYDALIARLIDTGGPMVITTIPDAAWMNRRLRRADPAAKVMYTHFRMEDNAHNLAAGAVERAKAEFSSDAIKMRVDGEYLYLSGIVYPEFSEEYWSGSGKAGGNLVKPFSIPRDWPRFRCLDFGMNHPTVCLWVAVSPDERLFVYREYRSRNTSCAKDGEAITIHSIGERFRWPVVIDPAAYQVTKANEVNVAQQYEAAGLPCTPGVHVASYGEFNLVQQIKKRLEDRNILVFDTCVGLINEFGSWEYRSDANGNPVGGESFVDANNDGLDALKHLVAMKPCFYQPTARVGVQEQEVDEDA